MSGHADTRTPLVLIAGWSGDTGGAATSLLTPGTAVVHHDLGRLGEGIVVRTLRTIEDGRPVSRTEILELAHGCVSCTLREDVLPLLARLHQRSSVRRIVLQMDPELEPEALSWAIRHVVVADVTGRVDGPVERDVRIEAVVTCLDAATWLADATGGDDIDDDRTVAQIVVGQVAFADALVANGVAGDGWEQAKLHAVLTRLAPGAPVVWGDTPDVEKLLNRIPPTSRRGEISGAFDPLLRGQPPLTNDFGVALVEFTAERPFHPGRLHEAIDVLLDGVVSARGRVWVATQPDAALWLESAGEGLRVESADRWLAAMTPEEQDRQPTARRALAALGWTERFGDRHTSMVVLVHAADPTEIDRALQWALVTDEEWADEAGWADWEDPFGRFHADPCESVDSPYSPSELTRGESDRKGTE
ncbi:GTPase, G3E family [Rhodococcus triatomae]|uniref:GTPase, G3E family n=1 Tax=Rhodococcus triatomae TaxID=300028 RepID=A0A1G8AB85_9NOCA|nr:GTPase, G3E family [Rhodococcus triatomae]